MCSFNMIIGLTGSFGTGKSTVARLFKKYRAFIIDADEINHQILKENKPVIKKIAGLFGREILAKDGTINRKNLAQLVFKNKKDLSKLCKISHPIIIVQIKNRIKKINRNSLIVIDAPLLIEAGLNKLLDYLIVVKADKETLVRRLKKKGFSRNEVLHRLRIQLPLRYKLRLADFVIDNNGALNNTKKQIDRILQTF